MVKRQVSKRNFVCHFSVWAHAENVENGPFPAPPGSSADFAVMAKVAKRRLLSVIFLTNQNRVSLFTQIRVKS